MEGSSFSYFRIVSKIGQGGMGEVWEATDTKLNRRVALKLLPEVFAHDKQRMGRFQREAQVLASLNHPNIAAIYGLEDTEEKKALVMELVEGEDLSSLIARSPIPLEQAAGFALQIARALESAHEKGIVHRDLKPANVKITSEGSVKVLDFGLAKAMENDASSDPDPAHSPTLSLAATQAGVILGTAAYMAPEQARGRAVDRRADIWAFGVVFYEMLTGKKAFEGEDLSMTLASVMTRQPDWDALPGSFPPSIKRLLKRCLEKEPKQRLQWIGEARIILESFLANPTGTEAEAVPEPFPVSRGDKVWKIAAAVLLCGILVLSGAWVLSPDEVAESYSLEAAFDGEGPLLLGYGASTVFSPDGKLLAYTIGIGSNADNNRLFLRSLDMFESREVDGGRGGYHPFFSPDGQWVGFVTRQELKKAAITGGAPLKLCEVVRSRGASWGPNGLIALSPSTNSPLVTVSEAGGETQELTALEDGETSHRWPQFLPDGEHVLFTALHGADIREASLKVVNIETGKQYVIHRGGTYGRYLRSGHLLFWREGTVFAAAFNPGSLTLESMPAPAIQDVRGNQEGGAQFDVSETGNLIYLEGGLVNTEYDPLELAWLDRNGMSETALEVKTSARFGFSLSPDGKRLAGTRMTNGNVDQWIFDMERGTASRLTFDEGIDGSPVWSPDGKSIYYSNSQGTLFRLIRTPADGSGGAQVIYEGKEFRVASSISSDGKNLFLTVGASSSDAENMDIWVISTNGKEDPKPVLQTPFPEFAPKISPDDRWLAYCSRETGDTEVYVRSFDENGGKWQISASGGSEPRWSKDGKKIFYLTDEGMMEAEIEVQGSGLNVGAPRLAFARPQSMVTPVAVAPDGERLLILKSLTNAVDGENQTNQRIARMTINWFPVLDRMLGRVR